MTLRGVLSVAVVAMAASSLGAQTPSGLASECVRTGGPTTLCLGGAVSTQAVLGHVGLATGLGSEVTGTASNLGTRVGGGPRIAFTLRAGTVDAGMIDPADVAGTAEKGFRASALHAGVTLGLFDGFRLMPTVGGFLATDVFGGGSVVLLPVDAGFVGNAKSYGVGVRVGIFREGFSIPGLSVSWARRFSGAIEVGEPGVSPSAFEVEPSTTSIRATIGKDIHAVELLAGMGWEEYIGASTLEVNDGFGGRGSALGDMSGSRRLYFGSAAMTFSILLTLSLEGGWAEGFESIPGYSGEYDPAGGAAFGSASIRLTL